MALLLLHIPREAKEAWDILGAEVGNFFFFFFFQVKSHLFLQWVYQPFQHPKGPSVL